MKKIVVLILALCLLVPSLALAAVTAPGTFPITDTPEELSIFTTITAVQEPYEDDYQTKFYEEKTGVKVNWLTYNNNEIATQYNLSLASQEYPDIYVYIQDPSGWMELIDEEIIIPLDDLIENHTVHLKKYLEENPDIKAAVTAPDGHIYTLPQVRYEECESTYAQKMWVYKEWLDAYCKATGNAIPATTEEFKQMLIYFRDNDMNGNGDAADEIPLTGTYSRWSSGSDPLFYLMNSFIYCPFTFLVADENNNITTPVVEDAYREGLRYINDLYKEGLLYEGTYVQELTQFRAMTSVAKDAVTVGAAAAGYPMRLLTQGSGTTWADYQALAPMKGPDGTQIAAADYVNFVYLTTAITSACENPELAIRWMDYWYSEEGLAWYLYNGVENVDWKWVDEPSFGGGDKSIVKITDRANETWLAYARPVLTTKESWLNMAAAETPNNNYLTGIKAAEPYMPYAQYTKLPQVVWCNDLDLTLEMAELKSLIVDDYIISASTQFIIGTRDINNDADWNDFLKGLEERGLERYLEVCEQYYFGK